MNPLIRTEPEKRMKDGAARETVTVRSRRKCMAKVETKVKRKRGGRGREMREKKWER